MKKQKFVIKPGNALPLGVTKVSDGVQFAVYLPECTDCYLKLYKKNAKNPEYRIALTEQYRVGSVYFVLIQMDEGQGASLADVLTQEYEYMYEADGKDIMDPYAAGVSRREKWAKGERDKSRCLIMLQEFDWEGDFSPRIPFSDSILYQLHVRGFTKHSSSKVKKPGTFHGLCEKIPYLKELGINGVFLLPSYEFQEIQPSEVQLPANVPAKLAEQEETKLNYWGYGAKDTYYFAPKAAYSSNKIADIEFKEMVRELHKEGIEVLMDFYFAPGTNLNLMTDCLRHWVLNYHIDGFRVNTEVMPAISLVSDPILSGVKLLSSYWDPKMISEAGARRKSNALAEFNEGFMNDARKFLKSDEGQVEAFFYRFYRKPEDANVINYITSVNGFTLMDLVSYDIKHNEKNGENGTDGTEYNYSWNCGVEGKSRKKSVVDQRLRQIRNAFFMLLSSQGTPMILAGDEFGNSQEGNNNPYCQDNTITWLNWRKTNTSTQIFEYVKKLITFRKEHVVLHQDTPLRLMDTLSCGVPDLSAHGLQTWRPDFSNYSRMLGILLSGKYTQGVREQEDDSIYIIFNMYWETKSFDLPILPDGKSWHAAIETYDETFHALPPRTDAKKSKSRRSKAKKLGVQMKTIVPPRSIVVFVGR